MLPTTMSPFVFGAVLAAAAMHAGWNAFLKVKLEPFLAMTLITGCAGGVLRDVLCNEVPLLFRKELYASVSLVTGAL